MDALLTLIILTPGAWVVLCFIMTDNTECAIFLGIVGSVIWAVWVAAPLYQYLSPALGS